MIRIGGDFNVPGIRFQSDPEGIVYAADLSPGTVWTARTAGASLPAEAPREDGCALRIAKASREKRRAFAAKIFISATTGVAGFGPLSDQTAGVLEEKAARVLGAAKENLIAAAAGPVLEHYPVGSMIEALEALRGQPYRPQPLGKGADALGMPFRIAEGAMAVGAALFRSERSGSEVWMAATSIGFVREALEGFRDRLWLAGPAAWRAAEGAHPGDVLLLLSTGASPMAEIASEEDPRAEAVIEGFAAALAQLARRRALAEGNRIPFGLFGAASPREAEEAAGVLARFLARAIGRASAVLTDESRSEAILDALRAALLAAPLPGLERALVRAEFGDFAFSAGLRKAAPLSKARLEDWKRGRIELRIDLGRGRSGARFWI